MGIETLDQRLIGQLSPLAPLLNRLIEAAVAEATQQRAAAAFPGLRRPAHLRRVSGLARWGEVADGLVAAAADNNLPPGFRILTTEAQHNRGQYTVRFPGGVLTFRRSPHDDEKSEGAFLQQQFDEIVQLLDRQGAPAADELVRVWIAIEATGDARFSARDRHGHETTIALTDLLAANERQTVTRTLPLPAPKTRVRSAHAHSSKSQSK